MNDSSLGLVLAGIVGTSRTQILLDSTLTSTELLAPHDTAIVSRAAIAHALALLLFDDLIERVPLGRTYFEERRASGQRITIDHGALRTVATPSGALPPGRTAFTRFLEPLGYAAHATYSLDRLAMTGYAFAHVDLPEAIPQYFVSELHPERLAPAAQVAVARVVASSCDPIDSHARDSIGRLAIERALPLADAIALVRTLASCFDRHHGAPRTDDYDVLLAHSPEMAWIATEGNAFNHATDRVADLDALAREQRALGRPIKAEIEVSRSGRIQQTAFLAAQVVREFQRPDGGRIERTVPGSFFEFISRAQLDDGRLDLAFDAANAQAIFGMTSANT